MPTMKRTLDHLPEQKQYELNRAVDIILEMTTPDMIILFGSYARGDWQEEPADDGHHFIYQSDFDLLLVTKNEHQATKIGRRETLHKRLSREIRTPISIIAEDINHLNLNLGKARYFYVDILREGILLHDTGKLQLAEARELTPAERRKLAEEYFAQYMTSAAEFFDQYEYGLMRGTLSTAAFLLHQVAERLYNAVLLVFTNYKPKTHDLAKLSERVTSLDPEFLKVFPQGSDEDKRRFELLRSAYVDARYVRSYAITAEELQWLAGRVKYLRDMADRLCRLRVEGFVEQAAQDENASDA